MSSLGAVISVSPLWRGDGAWRREHLQSIYGEYMLNETVNKRGIKGSMPIPTLIPFSSKVEARQSNGWYVSIES